MWVLTEDTTFTAIPPTMIAVTTETVLTGQSVLILARRPEAGAEIRNGLLEALEPARTFEGVAEQEDTKMSGEDNKDESSRRVPYLLSSVDGSAPSDNGDHIKIGVTSADNQALDLVMPIERGTDLLVMVGAVLEDAARRRLGKPDFRYMYPAHGWKIAPQSDGRIVIVFSLTNGPELCFQLNRTEARSLLEGLSASLGVLDTPPVPKNKQN